MAKMEAEAAKPRLISEHRLIFPTTGVVSVVIFDFPSEIDYLLPQT
jgi:hypothetical protein